MTAPAKSRSYFLFLIQVILRAGVAAILAVLLFRLVKVGLSFFECEVPEWGLTSFLFISLLVLMRIFVGSSVRKYKLVEDEGKN
jgi:hypothetical protein